MVRYTKQIKTSTLCLLLSGLFIYVFSLTIYADTLSSQTTLSGSSNGNSTDEMRTPSSFAQILDSRSSLPVFNNHFVVDKDVSEIEILLTTDKFDSIKLLSPQGKTLIPSQTSSNITWQRIEKMYAIKVQNPEPGQWEVQGSMLSRPEVAVTSSLDMITPIFPNNVVRGETLALSAYLQENGQRIVSGDLLKNMQITATLQNVATSEVYKIYLKEDEKIHLESLRGLFHYNYHLETLPGIYILDIKAIGLLFQRERRQQFYVHDYPAKITTTVSAADDLIQVDAVIASTVLDVASSQLSAVFHNTDGSAQNMLFEKKDQANWQLIIPYNRDIDRMTVTLAGYLKDSRPVQVTFPMVNIESLYEKSYFELQQNLELKSQKSWEKMQDQAIASILPSSLEKQKEDLMVAMNPFEDPDLAPMRQYTTFEQDLLQTWQSFLFPKTADEILGIENDFTKSKTPVLTKEQMQAMELAQAKEKVQQEKLAAFAHKKKILIIVLIAFCFIFILMLAAIIWVMLAPKRKKKLNVEEQPLQTEQAPAEVVPPPAESTAAPVEVKPVIKKVASDVKEDINALVSDQEPTQLAEEKPAIKPKVTQVINEEPTEKEPQVKKTEPEPEKQEIKMDVKLSEEPTKEASKETAKVEEPVVPPPGKPEGEQPKPTV